MKKIHKRMICLLMITVLCCSLLSFAGAAKNVVLTAVNDSFLPLSSGTMPTRQNGEYYVPYTVFSGRLGLRAAQRDGTLSLSSGSTTLTFNTAAGTVYDQNMNSYSSPAYTINGTVYVPIRLVCGRFGFSYSTLHSGDTLILRICSSSAGLSDSEFLSSTSATIHSMLNAYNGTPGPAITDQPPVTGDENVKKPSSIRFIVSGAPNDSTTSILSSLKKISVSALFALPPDPAGYSNAILREIAGAQHQFAFSISADAPADVDALTLANQKLFEATGMTTRLLYIEPDASALTAEQRDSYTAAGYRIWDATHRISASASASKAVSDLTKAFSETTTAVILSLPYKEAAAKIITNISNYMQTYSVSAQKINVLSSPMNHANDRR